MEQRIVWALVLLVVAGCASQRGAGQFPTPAELRRITPVPEARSLLLAERKDVPTWQVEGPLPESDAQSVPPASSPWAQDLDVAAQGRPTPLLRTAAMECAARELGRFYLEYQGRPAEGLQSFMLSVCGSDVSLVQSTLLQGDVPDEVPTDRLMGDWSPRVRELIVALLASGKDDRGGVWFGRAHGRAVVMIAVGESRATFSVLPRVPDEKGRVRIRGRLKESAESVIALVNHGRFGVEDCDTDPRVAIPEFVLSCPVARTDAQAWISIAAFPPGRVLGDQVLDFLVWPAGARTGTYERPARMSSDPVATADQVPGAVVRALNAVRREARLPEVELAREQSETARQLAPRYLLALMGDEPAETADKIALGMMAGWEVRGILRHGRVTGAFSVQTRDVGDLLAAALEFPTGRYALLDPEARAIAIGPMTYTKGPLTVVGALVGTYAFFGEDEDLTRASKEVFDRLVRAARKHGIRDVTRSDGFAQVAAEAARAVHSGKMSPERAMETALAAAANQGPGVQVEGLMLEVSEMDQIAFQEDFFKSASLRVGVAVTYYKPSDWPWGRYVVLVVAAGEQPLLTASAH